MKAIALLYHDVVEDDALDRSGFSGPDADLYKIDPEAMEAHLGALATMSPDPRLVDEPEILEADPPPLLLTFDDGGVSAATRIAPMLEERGWRGHFFITTDRIGTTGFLSLEQVRDLHARGHMVGSHSRSHPFRMNALTADEIEREWTESLARLSEILGEAVEIASVPGGHHSLRVARAASAAGLRFLFTSEPRKTVTSLGDCLVLGRFAIRRGMGPRHAAAFASAGLTWPQVSQKIAWNVRKPLKRYGGTLYEKVKNLVIRDS